MEDIPRSTSFHQNKVLEYTVAGQMFLKEFEKHETVPPLNSTLLMSNTTLHFNIIKVPTWTAKIFGFLPYTLDNNGSSFSPTKFPFLLHTFHILFSIAYVYIRKVVQLSDVVGERKTESTSTETFSEILVGSVVVWCRFCLRILILFEHRGAVQFHNKVQNCLRSLGEDLRLGHICLKYLNERAEKFGFKLKLLMSFSLIVMFACHGPITCIESYHVITNPYKISTVDSVGAKVVVLIALLVKCFTAISEGVYMIWIMSLIVGLEVGFLALEQFVKSKEAFVGNITLLGETTTAFDCDRYFTKFVTGFNEVSALIEEFSKTFCKQIILLLLSNCVIWVVDTFLVISIFTRIEGFRLSMVGMLIFTFVCHDTFLLFLLPLASSHLTKQRTRALQKFAGNGINTFSPNLQLKLQGFIQLTPSKLFISPGNYFILNKQMLTSMFGFLATYVLVFVQFEGSEKH